LSSMYLMVGTASQGMWSMVTHLIRRNVTAVTDTLTPVML